jgi:glycosyltransferase involved in cell wall biosynthesis
LFEGLSFSLLEAMSVGVPVVVTKVDGNQDVVNGTNGCVSNDVDTLVEGVRKLLIDQQYREKMGMTGYNYVKQYNNVDNVKAIYQNYSTLLSHQRINKNAGQLQMEPAGRI